MFAIDSWGTILRTNW